MRLSDRAGVASLLGSMSASICDSHKGPKRGAESPFVLADQAGKLGKGQSVTAVSVPVFSPTVYKQSKYMHHSCHLLTLYLQGPPLKFK